jgi:hypothetical protein
MVALTNNTSTEEDTLVGRSGALEVLGQVLSKGNEEGRVTAASALANLIASSDARPGGVQPRRRIMRREPQQQGRWALIRLLLLHPLLEKLLPTKPRLR